MNESSASAFPKENSAMLKANLYVIASGILYGFLGFLGTNIIQNHISLSNMLFWRFLVAGCWMLIFSAKRNYQVNIFAKSNKGILFFMFMLGAIGYAGASGFYFIASRYTGTGIAMVIFFCYPIMVLLFAWLAQGKKITIGTMVTLITLIVGLYLLQDSKKHVLSLVGIFWSILAALSYAIYVIGSKKYSSLKIDSSLLTIMVCFGCACIFFIFAIFTHSLFFPWSIRAWIFLLALGILATAVPIQLMLEGLKHVSSMRASIISVLEPLVTLLVGILLMHEPVSGLQLFGAFIVLAGTMLVLFQSEEA